MQDLVPFVSFGKNLFFLYSDRKKRLSFLIVSLHLRKAQLHYPVHNIYGGCTVCIGTGFKPHIEIVSLHHDLFQALRKAVGPGRIFIYIQTLVGLFIKYQSGWQGFQRNERSAVCHCKKRFPGPAPIWWNNPAELPFQNPCPAPHPWY